MRQSSTLETYRHHDDFFIRNFCFPCETHHLRDKNPLYQTVLKVLKYHNPGLAPVIDEKGAYHINLQGLPAYPFVFKRTLGFMKTERLLSLKRVGSISHKMVTLFMQNDMLGAVTFRKDVVRLEIILKLFPY